ncbi:hypothetical protein RFI_33200 [Reticulomyxa filosa]|uniref:Kelch motif family protein n=1 Tax=Reticulomyxa filosa TaxID=46433 RepID=X6LQN0_RETFI|nr:hypothetical protein RFI_33200 [Reticulomyxa filosa]|eukprot:ETO04198.1 hypothetical protein RFI_33200 [Reticulomyxa filosa]
MTDLTLRNEFISEPHLPTELSGTQCVAFEDELLICGGFTHIHCYSYHTKLKAYRRIRSYPDSLNQMRGHVVIACSTLLHHKANEHEIILLSFGGKNGHCQSHTLMMKYHSVWNDKQKQLNEWISLINEQTKEKLALREYIDGTRACIGGTNLNLLFITYQKKMDILDLNNFQYLQTEIKLPQTYLYHCMVPFQYFDVNLPNYFILMQQNQCLLLKFDEATLSMKVEKLPFPNGLKGTIGYGYVCVLGHIVLFGGRIFNNATDSVYIYSIANQNWIKSTFKLPVRMGHS